MNNISILIDNGHGCNTSGKQSPDGRLREYKWTRDFAKMLVDALKNKGYDARLVVTEDYDVSITERCKRVNEICKKNGASNVLLVSIHNNAAGMGDKWYSARGFAAYVSLNASANSKLLATSISKAMEQQCIKIRKPLINQWYWSQNLGICRETLCPAVLTENLFQDNEEDVKILLSEQGKKKLCEGHVNGIIEYVKSLNK